MGDNGLIVSNVSNGDRRIIDSGVMVDYNGWRVYGQRDGLGMEGLKATQQQCAMAKDDFTAMRQQ
jgi:hypothetical protein